MYDLVQKQVVSTKSRLDQLYGSCRNRKKTALFRIGGANSPRRNSCRHSTSQIDPFAEFLFTQGGGPRLFFNNLDNIMPLQSKRLESKVPLSSDTELVVLPVPAHLLNELKLIASRQGLTLEELVADAAEAIADKYESAPAPRRLS
jgi:hypothetical protein